VRARGTGRNVRIIFLATLFAGAACGATPTPTAPTTPTTSVPLNEASIIDALDYWSSTTGISYVLLDHDTLPRLLLRSGTDGLGTAISRGLIDGTVAGTNQAQSGLVVIRPDVATCSPSSVTCREVFRHEIGHALGYLDEPPSGLMSAYPDTDVLSDRERNMMVALYSLPLGAAVRADGSWSVAATGATGQLSDLQTAQDIITYNSNAVSGSSYRTVGVICRWQLPVPVYFQR
jgi:hypothetical protein